MALLNAIKAILAKNKDDEEKKKAAQSSGSRQIFNERDFDASTKKKSDDTFLRRLSQTAGQKAQQLMDSPAGVPARFIKNRIVEPVLDLPMNIEKVVGVNAVAANQRNEDYRNLPLLERAGAGLGVVGAFSPGPDDALFATYDAAKAKLAKRDAAKGFTGEETTGLGTALAQDTKAEDILNLAELPLLLGFGGVVAKKHAAGEASKILADEGKVLGKAFEYSPAANLSDEARVIEQTFGKQLQEDFKGSVAEYQKRFGNVLNTDNARELSADYNLDRSRRSAAVHEPASAFIKKMYEEELAKPAPEGKYNEVLFTAGGTGAGKSTAIRGKPEFNKTANEAQIVYDTNLSSFGSSKKKIEQARAAGKDVQIVYVLRDPVDAMVNGAVPRAERMGRTVPIQEHVKTHVESLDTIKKLAQEFANDEGVQIHVIDNSFGKGQARVVPIDALKNVQYNTDEVTKNVQASLEALQANGKLKPEIYEGFTGKKPDELQRAIGQTSTGDGGQLEPERVGRDQLTDFLAPDQEVPLARSRLTGQQLSTPNSNLTPQQELIAARPNAQDGELAVPTSNLPDTQRVKIEEDGKLRSLQAPEFEASLKYYDTPDAIKTQIEQLANTGYEAVQTQRRGEISFKETRALADALGMSAEDVAKRRPGKLWNAEQADAATRLMLGVNEQLNKVSQEVRSLRESGQEVPQDLIIKQADLATQAQAVTASILGDNAEAGRALNIRKSLKAAMETGDAKAKKQALKLFAGDEKKAQEVIKKLSEFDPDDNLGRTKFLRHIKPSTLMEKIEEYWYNSVLSNTATHVVNSTSNLAASLMSIPEKIVAGTLDATGDAASKLMGKAYKRDRYAAEAAGEAAGFVGGIKNGLRRMVHVLRNGISESEASKLEIGRGQAIKGPIGNAINIPSRALAAEDEFFKAVNYEMDLNAQATRMAKAEGLTGPEYHLRVANLTNDPTPQMIAKAMEAAKYKTFQTESALAQQLTRLRDIVKVKIPLVGEFKPLRFIIPFIQTPVNVVKYGLERSPLGLVSAAQKAATGASKGEVLDSASRAIVGSMAMATLASYFTEDRMTGAAPSNPKEKDAFYADGKLPWSVKIGDEWIAYNRIEPLNTVLRQIAEWHDASKAGDETVTEKVGAFMRSEARNVADQTFMTGVGNLVDAIEDPERFGQKFITDITGGFIPSIAAASARALDDTVRKPETIGQSFMARLPLISKDVPAMESSSEPGGEALRRTNEGTLRNFLSNFAGFRSTRDQGTNYQENVQRFQAADKLRREETDAVNQTVEELYQTIIGAPKGQKTKVLEDAISNGTLTPEVMEKFTDKIKDSVKSAGDNQEMTLLRGTSQETRARYTFDKLKSMDKEDRLPWLQSMMDAGIVTDKTMEQMNLILQEEKPLPLIKDR